MKPKNKTFINLMNAAENRFKRATKTFVVLKFTAPVVMNNYCHIIVMGNSNPIFILRIFWTL